MRNTGFANRQAMPSKNSRYQAQDKGPYNPFVLCRMFTACKGGKLRLFCLKAGIASGMAAVFAYSVSKSQKEKLYAKRKTGLYTH